MSKKLINYHISRLNSKNREVRIKSIQELVLLDAEEALDALQDVFKTDNDENVRRAAQEAGRKIFRKVRGTQETSKVD